MHVQAGSYGRRFALVGAMLVVAGCASSAPARLRGRWIGETMENVDAAELPAAVGWARGAVIDVQRSRITIAIPARVPRSAPFSVVEASGAEVTLAIERGDGALDTARFSLDQPDRIRWHIGDGRAVVMRREGTRPARLD